MDPDMAQTDKEREGEDHEMGDAPSQQSALSQAASQQAASIVDSKVATSSSGADLSLSATKTTSDTTLPLDGTILETTEKPTELQKMAPKKKGTAAVKKAPKRPKGGGTSRNTKPSKKPAGNSSTLNTSPPDGGSDEDNESDNGPYCLCRGPDNHEFMILCDSCDDWFHGKCIGISKEVGEHLIESFICPNCADSGRQTLFKKMCSLDGCMKPARLYGDDKESRSDFCSDQHATTFIDHLMASLPRANRTKNARPADELSGNILTGDQVVSILEHLGRIDEQGKFKIDARPFDQPGLGGQNQADLLTEAEEEDLKVSAADRYRKGEENILFQKMLQLLDMAADRRKALIASKQIEDLACGYDYRLDAVGVVGPFEHWLDSDEAKAIFKTGSLDVGSHLSGEEKNICDKKRCKAHQGWFTIHTRDVKNMMKVLAAEAAKMVDYEKSIREAAVERRMKKMSERNTVHMVGLDGELLLATV